jgi:hypothetical protein
VPARLGNNVGDASSTKRQGESDPAAALPEGLSPWLGVPEEGMTLASDAPPACRARPERESKCTCIQTEVFCRLLLERAQVGDFRVCEPSLDLDQSPLF